MRAKDSYLIIIVVVLFTAIIGCDDLPEEIERGRDEVEVVEILGPPLKVIGYPEGGNEPAEIQYQYHTFSVWIDPRTQKVVSVTSWGADEGTP